MAENHVRGVFKGCRKLGVDVRPLLQLLDLVLQSFVLKICGRGGFDFVLQPREDIQRFAAGSGGKCNVEADHTGAALFQLAHQQSIVTSWQRKRADCLQRLVINADDDDARVHGALTPEGEAGIEGALFYVLEKEKAGTLVARSEERRVGKECRSR